MFLLRDRTKFNSDVDLILRMSFEIETDSSKNLAFPSFISYLSHLSEIWNGNGTPEHAAVHMACTYCKSLVDKGDAVRKAEAQALRTRIDEAIPVYVSRGQLTQDWGSHYTGLLQKCADPLA
jgi:hypothetical protein